MKLIQLKSIGPALAEIEKELENAVATENPELQEASLHLLQAGGKRIRPVFVLISSQFGGAVSEDVKKVAVALELIHTASLVHDDVIDDSNLRRGRPTIKSKWDNRVAMYTGDFMFSKALEAIAQIDNPKLHHILSAAMVEMSVGEMEQIHDLYNSEQNLRNYLRRIKRKTALLIAVSCRLGSAAVGVDETINKSLYRFGYDVGMSFQITDDVLDFTGEEKTLGKPAGGDLKQGNVTLPVLYALQDGERRGDILAFLRADVFDESQWQQALHQVKESGAIEQSRHLSERYLQKAYQTLGTLPDLKAKQSLMEVVDYIGKRKS